MSDSGYNAPTQSLLSILALVSDVLSTTALTLQHQKLDVNLTQLTPNCSFKSQVVIDSKTAPNMAFKVASQWNAAQEPVSLKFLERYSATKATIQQRPSRKAMCLECQLANGGWAELRTP
ncbi:hypothetical protein LA080_009275 [Diaporthe eres]|nr:hypothetical protein LA080_009275 [Diaporthe eres]